MSLNNLVEHLTWLVLSKPHLPSSQPIYNYSSASDGLRETSSTAEIRTNPSSSNIQDAAEIRRNSPTQLLASESTRIDTNMVHMRTAPSPTRRPRLASSQSPHNRVLARTSFNSAPIILPDHVQPDGDIFVPLSQTLPQDDVDHSLDFHVPESPTKSRQFATPASSFAPRETDKPQRAQYDTIDLTDDIEFSDDWETKVSRSEIKAIPSMRNSSPSIMAGRKRKSDEYRSDLVSMKSGRGRSPQYKRCQASSPPSKHSIPGQTTMKEDLSQYFSSQDEDSLDEDKPKCRSSGQTKPRKSKRTEEFAFEDIDTCSEAGLQTNRVRVDYVQDIQEPPNAAPKPTQLKPELYEFLRKDPKANHGADTAGFHTGPESTSLARMHPEAVNAPPPYVSNAPLQTTRSHQPLPGFEPSALSQSKRWRLTELSIDDVLEPLQFESTKRCDDRTDAEKFQRQETLTQFTSLTTQDFRTHWGKLVQAKEDAKIACVTAAEENIDLLPDLQKNVQKCLARLRALQELVNCRNQHVALSLAKKELTASLFDIMEDDEMGNLQDVAAKVQHATKVMKENESALLSWITESSLDLDAFKSRTNISRQPPTTSIDVHSTQLDQPTSIYHQKRTDTVMSEAINKVAPHAPKSGPESVRRSRSPSKRNPRPKLTSEKGQAVQDAANCFPDFDDDFDDVDAMEAEMFAVASVPSTVLPGRRAFAERSANEMAPLRDAVALKQPQVPESQGEFSYNWSGDVKSVLAHRFRLKGFRPNQLNAINATLGAKDVFVLMPTGGGKSLCYQLPALIQSGTTKGVTVVISPLLSLMEDQVSHLEKLQIQAKLINGATDINARAVILSALRSPRAETLVQLLYLTPEMLRKSPAIVNVLEHLHRNNKLARLVIDEAHCVSQWGHDFRPDYKELGQMREQFPGVPLMALTATATENVRADVIHNLKMQGCEVLTQSFNRPNLFYEIRDKRKDKEMLEEIADIIKREHRGQSGIIYCLSKKTCEKVAEALSSEHRIKAHHYHAGMEPQDKSLVQRKWQAREYQVIVATIAFGMGIDKPDVRFVIHHSIPKSLEGYYQETGRAGRDGKSASCYLYYAFRDYKILEKMIWDSEDSSGEQKTRLTGMLKNVIRFCQNKLDCRRSLVLAYFGERFGKADCMGRCDNCKAEAVYESKDLTNLSRLAIKLVRQVTRGLSPRQAGYTLIYFIDLFRGKGSVKEPDHKQLSEYGAGSELDRTVAERLFHRLLIDDVFAEHNVANKRGFVTSYIMLGRSHGAVERGNQRVVMQVPLSAEATAEKSKSKTKPVANRKTATKLVSRPESTFVSSPVQQAERARARQITMRENGYDFDEGFVINDDDLDDDDLSEDNAFEPIEPGRKVKNSRIAAPAVGQELFGPRITIDERLEQLDPIHQHIVENFVDEARKINQARYLQRNLREVPFSDTILREMAIQFPLSKNAMCQLPGIDPDKVELHGPAFFKLIESTRDCFEKAMQADGDRPEDPNRRIVNVVDLVDSDEEDAFKTDLPSSAEEISPHFRLAPDVAAFNAQLQSYRNHEQSPDQASPPRRRGGSTGSKRGAALPAADSKRKYSRGSASRKISGASRAKSKKPSKPALSRSAQSKLTGGTAAFGISAMPT